MSKTKINYSAVSQVLSDYDEYDAMTPPRKAAYKARVTKYINLLRDEAGMGDVVGALTRIADKIGTPATAPARGLTAEQVIAEFGHSYDDYDPRQRGAFKAKAKRLYNALKDSAVPEHIAQAEALERILMAAEKADMQASRANLMRLASMINDKE